MRYTGGMTVSKNRSWMDSLPPVKPGKQRKRCKAQIVALPSPKKRGRVEVGDISTEARALLKLGSIRLLRQLAGVDDYGEDQGLDARTSKDCAQALSLLLAMVPDVLSLGDAVTTSPGHPQGMGVDLATPEGRDLTYEALRALPPELLREALKNAG